MKRIDVAPVVMKRTEEGKRLRKAYEAGQIHHGFNEHRVMSVHWGGVQYNFYSYKRFFDMRSMAMRYVKVKQNTKSGYAICELGGVVDLSYPSSKTRRGRVQGGLGESYCYYNASFIQSRRD